MKPNFLNLFMKKFTRASSHHLRQRPWEIRGSNAMCLTWP
jgi:hypothetical protein